MLRRRMDSQDLEKLEQRVDDLIGTYRRLHGENHRLKAQEAELSEAHNRLHEKMKLARARIESMIGRLKALDRTA